MQEIEREEMEVDVLIVGGGAAGLSAAIHVQNQIDDHNTAVEAGRKKAEPISEPMIVVLEKGPEVGAHSFSGAVLNPEALSELIPDYKDAGCPIESDVEYDEVRYLGSDYSFKLPITPPPFKNHGNHIISLSKFNRWLGEKAEEKGINVFPGFAAVEALYDGDRVIGVRTGDRGLDKDGNPKPNFEPGMILKSKLTIFAEGTRGSCFKQVAKKLNLYEGKNPEVFEHGVKEIIQMPEGTVQPGRVIHTLGFPLTKSIGGTFIYTIPGDKIIVGLVGYMDTTDPLFDPHRELQRLKTHPYLQKLLKDGQVIAYGGKTLPAGGWYSMPKLYGDGFVVCGDSASMVDVKRLKGIHLAMKSGMLAAETALAALVQDDTSAEITRLYEDKIHGSYVKDQLYKTRNFHQALSKGLIASMPLLAIQEVTGGFSLANKLKIEHKDWETTDDVLDVWGVDPLDRSDTKIPSPDGKLFYDKLSSVYLTGTMHDEDSPNHLLVDNTDICRDTCNDQYMAPCNHFCPANVYEMVSDQGQSEQKRLQVNYTNCIHCKACDIKCPFDNITWTPPEGGGGPQYTET